MNRHLPISTTLVTLALALSSFTPAFAQSTSSTTAIPPRLELEVNPGETITQEIKVRNETDAVQYYTVFVEDFIVTDQIGTPIPVTEATSGRWSLASWITAPKVIPVDPKQTQVLNLTITAPQNALPGGHYAMITYQPGDPKSGDLKDTGSLIGHRTGTLLYVTVPGDITQDALVKKFSTDKFHEYGPLDFLTIITNLSDIHILPQGQITIKDIFGRAVANLEVDMGNVFPEADRQNITTWNQKWGYGRYSANLELAYGSTGQLLNATIYFWFFPIRIVISILVLIIAILLLTLLLRRRRQFHEQELEQEVEQLRQELENKHKDQPKK